MELAISPAFSSPSLLLSLALLAYLLVGEPLLGRSAYGRLARTRGQDPAALTRFYRLTIAVEWGLAAAVAAIVLLSPGIDAADVGLRLPSGDSVGLVVGFLVALVAAMVVTTVALRRRAAPGLPVPGQQGIASMLPRTSRERALALAVALSAGFCEEIVYRGTAIAVGVGVFGLSIPASAALSCAVFALGHIYQGPAGTVTAAVLAAAFAVLYVATGSLLLPIALHVLVDVRGLLLVPAPRPAPGPTTVTS